MKILNIEYIETIKPNCSCGTGYSCPDKFHVICDTNLYENDIWHADSCETDIYIDTWYIDESRIFDVFSKEINNSLGNVSNIREAFDMYKKSLNKKR